MGQGHCDGRAHGVTCGNAVCETNAVRAAPAASTATCGACAMKFAMQDGGVRGVTHGRTCVVVVVIVVVVVVVVVVCVGG